MDRLKITSSFTNATWEGEQDLGVGTPEQKLERAFRLFNRVDDADVTRLEDLGYELPSMSAGDQIVLNGEVWRCDASGFSRDDRDPREPIIPWPLGA